MATLSTAAAVKASKKGSSDSLRSTETRQTPASPRSKRRGDDAVVLGGACASATTIAEHAPREATTAGVEDLISKLPDVLFPGEDDEALTPSNVVAGTSPGSLIAWRNLSRSAPDGARGHDFGGRASASPPSGGGAYQPPNRRSSERFSPPSGGGGARSNGLPPSGARRGKHAAPRFEKPVKKNPAPGFNGAGFRGAREVYVSKLHDFLCAKAIEGAPWVKLLGKDGVETLCEKPLTVPENYAEFLRDHAWMFELSPDGRYVAAKVPGEEHACIPPPPSDGYYSTSPSGSV